MPASGPVPETILGVNCSCAWHLRWTARLAGRGWKLELKLGLRASKWPETTPGNGT